jgi:GT2 family glycosyltransferase
MSSPSVAVIMLNWNGYADTVDCIESLKKITYPNFFIVIVDNASSGNDVQQLRDKYGSYVDILAQDKNWGFPEGCNIGMRYAMQKGADYLLLLNNDTIVDPEFLTELVKTAEGDEKVGVVGSKVYYYYYPNRIQYLGGRINWILGINGTYIKDEDDHGQYDKPLAQDYVPATSCIVKRAVAEKIGYLDPFYFWAIEEFDYCTRAIKAGFKVMYQPKSKIWHKWQASGVKLSEYPETQAMINKMVGAGAYKLWWRLYKTYSPPVLFLIPFLLQVSLVGPFCVLFFRGQWRVMLRGLLSRLNIRPK